MSHSEFPDLRKYPYWAFDTETTGLNYPRDRAFGASFAAPDGQTWYFDLRERDCRDWLEDMFASDSTIIGFNTQFDIRMLQASGANIEITRRLDDVMIRACLIDEHLSTAFPWARRTIRYSLDDLGAHYLGERKDDSIYGWMSEHHGGPPTRAAQIGRIHLAPSVIVAPYAKKDAFLTLRLWEWQEDEIKGQDIREICDFERRVMPTVIRASARGVPVDPARADRAMSDLTVEIDLKQAELNALVGRKFNVNSSPQVRDLFSPRQMPDGSWVADNGALLGSTDKGAASVNHEVLQGMVNDRRAELIDEVRSLIKTRDVFLGKYIRDDAYMGRVYPSINQTAGEGGGTRTGRFSYTDPALQQIPSRNKRAAKIVKSCFIAPEGMKWVDADLHSYEVRVFAHLVSMYNPAVTNVYKTDPMTDFHKFVADLTGLPRNPPPQGGPNAKQLNLSMIFNSGNGAIAHQMGLPWEWSSFQGQDGKDITYRKAGPEALALIEEYHARVQGVKLFANRMADTAKARGWIETAAGRRLRFPKGFKAYKASGLLIQATAADINKENWILAEEALGNDGFLILNTHDSYSMAIEADRWESVWGRVKGAIERPVMRVPLILELSGAGDNWWQAISGG